METSGARAHSAAARVAARRPARRRPVRYSNQAAGIARSAWTIATGGSARSPHAGAGANEHDGGDRLEHERGRGREREEEEVVADRGDRRVQPAVREPAREVVVLL